MKIFTILLVLIFCGCSSITEPEHKICGVLSKQYIQGSNSFIELILEVGDDIYKVEKWKHTSIQLEYDLWGMLNQNICLYYVDIKEDVIIVYYFE